MSRNPQFFAEMTGLDMELTAAILPCLERRNNDEVVDDLLSLSQIVGQLDKGLCLEVIDQMTAAKQEDKIITTLLQLTSQRESREPQDCAASFTAPGERPMQQLEQTERIRNETVSREIHDALQRVTERNVVHPPLEASKATEPLIHEGDEVEVVSPKKRFGFLSWIPGLGNSSKKDPDDRLREARIASSAHADSVVLPAASAQAPVEVTNSDAHVPSIQLEESLSAPSNIHSEGNDVPRHASYEFGAKEAECDDTFDQLLRQFVADARV